jgi:hypothetical protein
MALDVKYLRGTVAQYEAYLANTKDPNYTGNQKIVDTTYYLIYEHAVGVTTIGYPLLYIGQVLLSEAENINALSQNIKDMGTELELLKEDVEALKNGGSGTHPLVSIDKSLMPTVEDGSNTIIVLTDLDANNHTLTPKYDIAATTAYVDNALLSLNFPKIEIKKDESVVDENITIESPSGETTEVVGLVSIVKELMVDESNGHTLNEIRVQVPTESYVKKLIANITLGESAAEVKEYVDENFLKKDKITSTDENGDPTSIKITATQEGGVNVTLEWGSMKDMTE